MANTIMIKQQVLESILVALDNLRQDMAEVKEKLASAPLYESDKWWDWSIKQGLQDMQKGKFITIKTKKVLQEYLDSLK